ncbi:NADH:ubiquinone oxidoreductase 10.5kD subunit [Purpureocillium lilacinum]|uniref:NADH:ubiquinone oxidoreductase 10.5kD subunit n=1 Tax=Purpureocillium lilacinum TaxID=33203 RepID=A0A2U3E6H6_PURLI|nr:NADH:ubiquinone oxidoreductase 10.5kD subunit [Purpureocillium lilacinum]
MSSKYAFTKSLKEVRFLFCQTSEHSAAVRYVFSYCAGTPSSSPSSSPVSPPLRPEAEAEHLSLAVDARARCVVRPRAALVVHGRCTRVATCLRVQLTRSERNGRRGTGTKKRQEWKANPRALSQVIPPARLPDHEEEQPQHAHHDPRGRRHPAQDLCPIRSVASPSSAFCPSSCSSCSSSSFSSPQTQGATPPPPPPAKPESHPYPMLTRAITEFGTEKQQSLEGLSDKQIEETVTGLVKNGTAA